MNLRRDYRSSFEKRLEIMRRDTGASRGELMSWTSRFLCDMIPSGSVV